MGIGAKGRIKLVGWVFMFGQDDEIKGLILPRTNIWLMVILLVDHM